MNTNINNIKFLTINKNNTEEKKEIVNLIKQYLPEIASNLLFLFKNQDYDYMFGAYCNNKLVGVITAINKAKMLSIDGGKPTNTDEKTMYIDYLVVDKPFTSNKIGTHLINMVKEKAVENNNVYVSVNCPFENSFYKTIYDNHEFNRVNVNLLQPKSVEFRINVNTQIHYYGKLMQAVLASAKNAGYVYFDEFRNDILLDDAFKIFVAKNINLKPATVDKMINSNFFNSLTPVFESVISEGKNLPETKKELTKVITQKRENFLYDDEFYENQESYSALESYKDAEYSLKTVSLVSQCLNVAMDIEKNNQILVNKDKFLTM